MNEVPKEQTIHESDDQDVAWMRETLKLAAYAFSLGEVPIGAIVVKDGQVIGRGYNRREIDRNPLAHAELLAIHEAAQTLGGWRLSGTTLYVTLEPCPMCAGAIVQSRIDRLVYGARDPKAGCAGTLMNLVIEPRFNHQAVVVGGVLEDEAAALLKQFFQTLRTKQKEK